MSASREIPKAPAPGSPGSIPSRAPHQSILERLMLRIASAESASASDFKVIQTS